MNADEHSLPSPICVPTIAREDYQRIYFKQLQRRGGFCTLFTQHQGVAATRNRSCYVEKGTPDIQPGKNSS